MNPQTRPIYSLDFFEVIDVDIIEYNFHRSGFK